MTASTAILGTITAAVSIGSPLATSVTVNAPATVSVAVASPATVDATINTPATAAVSVFATPTTWIGLVTQFDAIPSFNATITGGDVYTYTYQSITLYRFVPTPYTFADDAFYRVFDGVNVSNQVTARS